MKIDYHHIWSKEYRKLLFIFGILVTSIPAILYIFYDYKALSLNEWLLAVTALVVFWYSRETFDLKNVANKQLVETRKQTFLNIRPFIRLQWINNDGIRIINEGYGIALNVRLSFNIGGTIHRTILSGEKATKSYTDAGFEDVVDKQNSFTDSREFKEKYSPIDNDYNVDVTYQDVSGIIYLQTFKTDKTLNDKFRLKHWDIPEDFKSIKMKKVESKDF
ncbi:MAG: hypothetical protein ABIF80_01765 [Patescibacteria group bacterium]